jgi:hypothetical protein
VILSAMLVAGVIVFVNQQENFKAAADTAKAQAQQASAALQDKITAYDADVATYKSNANTLAGALDTAKQKLAEAQTKISEQAAQVADLSSKMAVQGAENAKLAEAIKASQDAQTKLNDAVAQLRKDSDTRVAEATQLNTRISELTNNLEVTERERAFLAEQLTESRSANTKMSDQLKAAGFQPDEVVAKPGPARLPINGVVRNVDTIAGSLYATISVGRADSVEKGMQFNVVEARTEKFLGILTVTAVEANEASGRVTGPATNQIGPGAEVKTQLK